MKPLVLLLVCLIGCAVLVVARSRVGQHVGAVLIVAPIMAIVLAVLR